MKTKDTILPLRTAARALGIKAENLKIEAEAGRVPHTKIGDEYMFVLSTLEASIARRVKEAVANA